MQILLNIEEGLLEELCPNDAYIDWKAMERVYGLRKSDESIDFVNIGPGADWIVLLTTFNTVWTIFQLPGVIKKSLEGWQWLVEKLKSYKSNKKLISLDIDAAGMLAIDYLAEKYGDDSNFDLMDAHAIPIVDITGMVRNVKPSLADHPYAYYIYTFSLAGRIIVMSVRSTGEIRELEAFNYSLEGLEDYVE